VEPSDKTVNLQNYDIRNNSFWYRDDWAAHRNSHECLWEDDWQAWMGRMRPRCCWSFHVGMVRSPFGLDAFPVIKKQKHMKPFIGIILMILGVFLGLYVGLYVCFIGGIIDLVNVVNESRQGGVIPAPDVAWAIAKIVFAGAAGVLSAWCLLIPGYLIATKD
jgi:hypothetical protein